MHECIYILILTDVGSIFKAITALCIRKCCLYMLLLFWWGNCIVNIMYLYIFRIGVTKGISTHQPKMTEKRHGFIGAWLVDISLVTPGDIWLTVCLHSVQYFIGSVQDCGISSADTLEIPQSFTKPFIGYVYLPMYIHVLVGTTSQRFYRQLVKYHVFLILVMLSRVKIMKHLFIIIAFTLTYIKFVS